MNIYEKDGRIVIDGKGTLLLSKEGSQAITCNKPEDLPSPIAINNWTCIVGASYKASGLKHVLDFWGIKGFTLWLVLGILKASYKLKNIKP